MNFISTFVNSIAYADYVQSGKNIDTQVKNITSMRSLIKKKLEQEKIEN